MLLGCSSSQTRKIQPTRLCQTTQRHLCTKRWSRKVCWASRFSRTKGRSRLQRWRLSSWPRWHKLHSLPNKIARNEQWNLSRQRNRQKKRASPESTCARPSLSQIRTTVTLCKWYSKPTLRAKSQTKRLLRRWQPWTRWCRMRSYLSESRYRRLSQSWISKTRLPSRISVESYLKRRSKRSVMWERRRRGSIGSNSKRRLSAGQERRRNAFRAKRECAWIEGLAMRIPMVESSRSWEMFKQINTHCQRDFQRQKNGKRSFSSLKVQTTRGLTQGGKSYCREGFLTKIKT